MPKRAVVCLCTVVAVAAIVGVPPGRSDPVRAATATVSADAPLLDAPVPGATTLALLPAGTAVSVDGPPEAGFYPVTAGAIAGWMQGEVLSVDKEEPAGDLPGNAVPDDRSESVPGQQSPSDSASEGAFADPTAADGLAPEMAPNASAAATPEHGAAVSETPFVASDRTDSTVGSAETPVPILDAGPRGPAGVTAEEDRRLGPGPGPAFGLIAMAPAGSVVEQTGLLIDGYVTVQFAEVTGWVPLDHLGPPLPVSLVSVTEEAFESGD